MTPVDPIVPACWLNDSDLGAIVKVYATGIPDGRLESVTVLFQEVRLVINGDEFRLGRNQLVIVDSYTAERIASDADRRIALYYGRLLRDQPEFFRTLRDGDEAVSA